MRAAIYARVSSAGQRDRQTVQSQLQALRLFVAEQGWELAGEYVDDGRSAKAGKLELREGFARLVRDAGAGAFQVLVVLDVNRLTRTDDLRERAEILGPFQAAGIDIVTPTGGRQDLRTMFGELWVTMHALVAAEESRKKKIAVAAGRARAIASGRKHGGPTPFGWKYSRDTGEWSLHEQNAETTREGFRRVIAGEACAAICDDFHARGIAGPRAGWSRFYLWKLLTSRRPIGEWHPHQRGRRVIPIPAIVDVATWHAAQTALAEHGRRTRGLKHTKHIYLLEGLGVCGMCGAPVHIRSKNVRARGTIESAYVCRDRKVVPRGGVRCPADSMKCAEVDDRVWAKISAWLESPNLSAKVAAQDAANAANRTDWQADVERYRAKLEQLAKAEAGVAARYRKGLLSEDAFDLELGAAARGRAVVERQLEAAQAAVHAHAAGVPEVDAKEWVRTIRELARSQSPAARQRVVRAVVRGEAVFADREVILDLFVVTSAAGAPRKLSLEAGHTKTAISIRVVA